MNKEREPIIPVNGYGFTVHAYCEAGGCVGTWLPNMNKVFDFIEEFEPSHSIAIVKCKSKEDRHRHVVTRPKDLDDSGISTRNGNVV